MQDILNDLSFLDWTDIERVSICTQNSLQKLFSNRNILRSCLESVIGNPDLTALCEHYDFFDKIVLYRDSRDMFRIRLHIFLPEASHKDRPHNHRWIYSSIILQGSYVHSIYGTTKQINENSIARDLRPLLIQEEKAGSVYTLHPDVFHTVEAKPYTVSLMIRGPARENRFLVFDKKANRNWWEYERASETIEEIRRKAMPRDRMQRAVDRLYEMGVI